jgi:hypothetical protein
VSIGLAKISAAAAILDRPEGSAFLVVVLTGLRRLVGLGIEVLKTAGFVKKGL